MAKNINVGFLGHVDSGKTSIVRCLTTSVSTAALDKHPESRERGITIDLGFSSFEVSQSSETLRFTLVDCPGHSSLLRTIICGIQIIDEVVLVIDCLKGIQQQTAECIILAQLILRNEECLHIALNKTDLIEEKSKNVADIIKALSVTFDKTRFKGRYNFYPISTKNKLGIDSLKQGLLKASESIKRFDEIVKLRTTSFFMNVDHCFNIKGKGVVLTGTILSGKIEVGDEIEVPQIKLSRKVKSIQIFHTPVNAACLGDRVALLVTDIKADSIERTIITYPGHNTHTRFIVCPRFKRIKYYRGILESDTKFLIHCCNQQVTGKVVFFRKKDEFTLPNEFKKIASVEKGKGVSEKVGYILKLENDLYLPSYEGFSVLLIGLSLNMKDPNSSDRLCFHSRLEKPCYCFDSEADVKSSISLYNTKTKECTVDRVIDAHSFIIKDLFHKDINHNKVVGLSVYKSDDPSFMGKIISKFGKSGKLKVSIEKCPVNALCKGDVLFATIKKHLYGY